MGTWGYKLYDDDIALDIKESYISMLKKGVDSRVATQRMMMIYDVDNFDVNETPLFWLILADIQWNKAILENDVKEKAIYYIDSGIDLHRWKDAPAAVIKKRKDVLIKLKEKLLSPQPSKKHLTTAQYICSWNLGDVYAYPLLSDYAKEKGLYGKHFLFYKVGETISYPNHIIPVVWVKLTNDSSLPENVKEFNVLEYVQTSVVDDDRPVYREYLKKQLANNIEQKRDDMGELPVYSFALVNTSKRIIPKQLKYIGNFTNVMPPKLDNLPISNVEIPSFVWKFLEKNLINRYLCFNLRQGKRYENKKSNK